MKNFTKVLIVSPNYKLRKGGIASVLTLYKKYLKEDFFYVPSIYFQNIFLSTILFPFNLLELIVQLTVRKNFRIVHIHGSHGGSFYRKYIIFWISKKLFRKKVIYHLHSSDFQIFYNNASKKIRSKIQNLINSSDVIIVLSEEWRDFIINSFKPKNVRILENIVEKQNSYSWHTDNKKTTLLFLGRIGNRKGIFDLLDVIYDLKDHLKEKLELFIGGDGEIERLKNEIATKNLKNVQFVGWVKNQKKSELLNKCDIFVLPSYNEGLPISLLEAMSYGKPIISTKTGGIPRILENDINGYLIDPGSKDQLKKAIVNYLNDTKKIQTHGEEGLKMVENYYPKKVLDKLDRIYEDTL